MLLYGDVERLEAPGAKLDRIETMLRTIAAAPPGVQRHARIVGALIEAGELLQGLADVAFEERGQDGASPDQDAATALCLKLARGVLTSWTSDFAARPDSASAEAAALRPLLGSAPLRTRLAEGYAFYGLYPEAYLEAALRVGRAPGARVIGLRSIGAGLSAVVAAGLDTAVPPFTVRPTGPPFERRLELAPELQASMTAPASLYAVVDEGPGLSGSSFAAVVKMLRQSGVETSRIRLFPSHGARPGPQATAEVQEMWAGVERRIIEVDELIVRPPQPARRLESWAAELVGDPVAPLQELSAGAWRPLAIGDQARWPPSFLAQERRKFLMRTASGAWLLKFAGLGAEGERKLERARVLDAEGFGPETAGLVHGFLVQRWLEDARPLDPRDPPPGDLLPRLGAYLGLLARRFPASVGGAGPDGLLEMIRANAAEALGEASARRAEAWQDLAQAIGHALEPVDVDGRMHAWEWLRAPDGRLIKADALDHHSAHDLVGRQDIAWDVVGAASEFGLSDEEAEGLAREVGARRGRPIPLPVLGFMRLAYPAFHLGRSVEAARISGPGEAMRIEAAAERYAQELDLRLAAGPA